MCDLMTAMSIGTSVLGYIGDKNAADKENARQDRLYVQNSEASNAAFVQDSIQLSQKTLQEEVSAAQEVEAATRETRRAKASAVTSAAEAGVAGLSIDALVSSYDRDLLRFKDTVAQEAKFRDGDYIANTQGLDATRRNRINSKTPNPVEGPSILTPIIGIGEAAMGYYTTNQTKSHTSYLTKGGGINHGAGNPGR